MAGVLVGVVITNNCTVDVQPERAVPAAVMDLYCSVLLAGKSWSGHGATPTVNEIAKLHYS